MAASYIAREPATVSANVVGAREAPAKNIGQGKGKGSSSNGKESGRQDRVSRSEKNSGNVRQEPRSSSKAPPTFRTPLECFACKEDEKPCNHSPFTCAVWLSKPRFQELWKKKYAGNTGQAPWEKAQASIGQNSGPKVSPAAPPRAQVTSAPPLVL